MISWLVNGYFQIGDHNPSNRRTKLTSQMGASQFESIACRSLKEEDKLPADFNHLLSSHIMTEQSTNYDDVKQYKLDAEREKALVSSAGECVFIWANKAGHPIGVITAYVPVNGKIWMTATRERVRIKAIARDGRSSCVFTSKGTPLGGGKTVTYKGHTVIHDDTDTKHWFYQLLAKGMSMRPDDGNEFTNNLDPDLFVKFLDTPERVVLEFTPEMTIAFDGDKMAAGTAAAYAQFANDD